MKKISYPFLAIVGVLGFAMQMDAASQSDYPVTKVGQKCLFSLSQEFPSVPLSSFGMNSWASAKTPSVKVLAYCPKELEAIKMPSTIQNQKFPSVPLASFGFNSWMFAK